ncbi:NnrS family protein [Halomonas sp. NO4]|uniref:NnrS family protein n=1 Tax=Halomonas sp. NO4 TaxID=2484813 RepID=UPI0013D1CAAD|nr:NnrS family protein [Halomonas sp. NO4]
MPVSSTAIPGQRIALLAYGFRPFFLLAALYAPLALVPWVGGLLQQLTLETGMPPLLWHAHEMLFGFVAAALAGFLLTAIPSWAKVAPLTGASLAALVLLWLAGRATMWLAGWFPPALVAAVNLAFPLTLVAWALPALLSPEGRRHLSLGILLMLFAVTQLGFHLAWVGVLPGRFVPLDWLHLAANLLLVMIAVTASRIVRVVAMAAVAASGTPSPVRFTPAREHLAVTALLLFVVADFVARGHPVAGWIALAAAAAQADRLAEWPWGRAMGRLYLLLLTLAYVWLTVGLALVGLAALLNGWPDYAGRHALFLGAIGTAVLAVFCIAGLRHTGRPLELPRPIWAALVCLLAATVLRTGAPLAWPQHYLVLGVLGASLLWLLAYALYALSYARLLCQARPDGLPG